MDESRPGVDGNASREDQDRGETEMARLVSSMKQGDVGVVRIGGVLTGDTATTSVAEWVEEHFVDDGVTKIRIDLSEVTEIDLEGAAALGVLVAESIKRGKALGAEGASGQVRRKLEETGLARYLGLTR